MPPIASAMANPKMQCLISPSFELRANISQAGAANRSAPGLLRSGPSLPAARVSKQPAAAGKPDAVRLGQAGPVSRRIGFHADAVAGLQRVGQPALATQHVRAAQFQIPGLRGGPHHLQVEMDVRIAPFDLGDASRQHNQPGRIVFRLRGMVRPHEKGHERETGGGNPHESIVRGRNSRAAIISVQMKEKDKETAAAVAAAGLGAGVGGAGGATAGVLELATQGLLTGASAGFAILAGAAVGGFAGYALLRLLAKRKAAKPRAAAPGASEPAEAPRS